MYYTTTESSCIKYRIIDCEVHQEPLNDQTVKYKVTGIKRTWQAGWEELEIIKCRKDYIWQGQVTTEKVSVNILGLRWKTIQK